MVREGDASRVTGAGGEKIGDGGWRGVRNQRRCVLNQNQKSLRFIFEDQKSETLLPFFTSFGFDYLPSSPATLPLRRNLPSLPSTRSVLRSSIEIGAIRCSSLRLVAIIHLSSSAALSSSSKSSFLSGDVIFSLRSMNGKLLISSKALAKFITGCKRHGKISELSKLLLSIQMEYCSLGETILCSDVIDACIHLGWLETAHDILDDMESAGDPLGSTTYMSLIVAYYKAKMFREAEVLVRQMQKAGLDINISEEMVVSACLSEVADRSSKSDLAESLI
ncbi:hypothetical protein LWI29_000075 [Acer saccharum]|uniref:Pentatricopeptide repeat-containing protein n=1 Tax=Acer saccharum TaxID=4024 RepID=A0AA39VMY6_ACESA|nr:hypothetical protein LWI29_000075 [Acer saccharum]